MGLIFGYLGRVAKQPAARLRPGVHEDLIHRAFFRDTASVQDGDTVADLADHGHLMGDEDHCDAKTAVDVFEEIQDGLRGHGIQRAGSLIAEQHLGLACQSPGDGDSLTLAAGQLCRIGLRPVLQADDLKQFHHPLVRLPAGQSRNFKGVAHIFSDGALHQEVELLKDHAHLPAELEQIRPAHPEDILPAVKHFAARGHIKPVDAADQCRLSRPAHADDAIDLALSHIQADSVERYDLTLRRAVYLGQFPYLDQRLF